MKKLFIGALLLSLSLGAFAQYQREDGAQTAGNAPWEQIASQRRQLFNFDWKFRLGQVAGAADPALDDSAWRSLDLPHDFQFEQPWIENGRGSRAFKPMVETLLAVDNGDHYTDELFCGVDTKAMRRGFLQVILRSGRETGPVTVSLSSSSLKKSLSLQTR